MASINFLGILLFLALGGFSLFQLYIVFCSSKYKIWKLRYKYNPAKYNQNFNIAIYSHNSAEAVVELLENLKKQDYPLNKMKINIILDNCTDNSSNLLEILGGAKIWRILTEKKPVGRNAAFEWFLDKTLATENTNAFIFLDAKNRINPYLMSNINNAIGEFPVVTGRIRRQSQNTMLSIILDLYEKFYYNINLKGRSMAGLTNFVSTEILAIRQDVLEKVRFMNTPNQNAERIYSLLLSKIEIPVIYSDEVSVFAREQSTIKSFALEKYKDFIGKLKTFKYGINLLTSPACFRSKELIVSLVYPNDAVILCLFCLFIALSYNDNFILGSKLPLYLLSFSLVTTMYTIILAKLSLLDLALWPVKILTSPLALFGNFINSIKINKPNIKFPKFNLKFTMPKFKALKFSQLGKNKPKNTVNVLITNGTRDIPCELEIKNQDGLYTSILWFNNKKTCSNTFLRAADSLAELSEKLFNRGLVLKVCQNCGYFEPTQDGKHDFMNGSCLLGIVKHGQKDPYSTKISYNCKFIIPSHAREFVRKQIEELL